MAVTQTITSLPQAGHRGVDLQDAFVTKQEAFQDALQGTTVSQLNTAFSQINSTETNINNKEQLANDYGNKVGATVETGTYSAKEFAVGDMTETGGSAKAWATDTASPDGTTSKSAKSHAEDALASATASANSATNSANSATNSANSAISSANSATASANSATASANSATTAQSIIDNISVAPLWVSGSNYAQYAIVTDITTYKTFKAKVAITNSTIAPSSDATNWQDISSASQALPITPKRIETRNTFIAEATNLNNYNTTMEKIDETRAVIAYCDATGVKLRIATFNPTTESVSYGSSTLLEPIGSTTGISVNMYKVDTDKIIAFTGDSLGVVKATVFTTTGDVITLGTTVTVSTTAIASASDLRRIVRAVMLTTTSGILIYSKVTSNLTIAVGFTISGTTLTVGTEVQASATVLNSNYSESIGKLSNTKALLVGDTIHLTLTLTGTTITLGAEAGSLTTQTRGGIIYIDQAGWYLVSAYNAINVICKFTISGDTIAFDCALGCRLGTIPVNPIIISNNHCVSMQFGSTNQILQTGYFDANNFIVGYEAPTKSRVSSSGSGTSERIVYMSGYVFTTASRYISSGVYYPSITVIKVH